VNETDRGNVRDKRQGRMLGEDITQVKAARGSSRTGIKSSSVFAGQRQRTLCYSFMYSYQQCSSLDFRIDAGILQIELARYVTDRATR